MLGPVKMNYTVALWKKTTQTRALEQAGPYETAFFEAIYRLRYITGISTWDPELYYTVYSTMIKFISLTVFSLEIWFVSTEQLSLEDFISSLNVILIHCLTIWKIVMIMGNTDIYNKLGKAMENSYFAATITTEKRRNIIKQWSTTHSNLLSTLFGLATSTLATWYMFPLIDEVEYNYSVNVRLPMDHRTPTRYAISYVIIIIMFNSASYLVVMTEAMIQVYLIHLICQFAVLADCFENIIEDVAVDFPGIDHMDLPKNNLFVQKYLERLGNLVDQHRLILKHTAEMQTILSAPMLGQLSTNGMLICFIAYQAITTVTQNLGKFIMSFLYSCYNMFTLYIICRWCEEITLQSQRIGEGVYFSGWERGLSAVPGVKTTVMLVMARSIKPIYFLAGGMYILNLSSYTDLVKASYSALNILLRMSHE